MSSIPLSDAHPARTATPHEDFSLVLGGPLYQMYLRGRLLKPPADLLGRRIVVFIVIAWLPLLALTLASGTALGGVEVPFVLDIDVHIRFLVALPLMIGAELLVHQRMRRVVQQFIERGIVTPEHRERFEGIIDSVMRLRNSAAIEIAILVGSTTLGYWVWREGMSLHVGSWYVAAAPGGGDSLTVAGWWYAFVSLNLFRFVLFRWYFRIIIWYVFLWRVARMPLRLNALHPDRAGGLGFLGGSVFALMPLLLAHSAVLAGVIAGRIWHEGAKLPAFQLEMAGTVAFLMVLALLPLTFFLFQLARAKREGAHEYGLLATQYVDEFRDKWMRGTRPEGEPLVGAADIQSLADLAGGNDVVREMRLFPLGRQTVVTLAVFTALPFLPLALTMIPFEELITRVLGKLI